MAEILDTITAGRHTAYEIVESDDRLSIIVRSADQPENQIKLIRSVVPVLAAALAKIEPFPKPS